MKRKFSFFTMVLTILLSLFSCSEIQSENGTESFDGTKWAENANPIAQNYISMVKLQKSALENGLSAISQYINIDEEVDRSALSTEMAIEDFECLIPDDISCFKRLRSTDSRSVSNEEEYITLEEELDEIAENFEQEFEKLLPEPTDALKLDYIAKTESALLLGDDMEIPLKSIEGAVTVQILNAIANGDDVEDAVNEIEDALSCEFGSSEEDVSRGVWLCETTMWPNNVVYYKWGNISDVHKQAILDAMRLWESKTSNCIKFREFNSTRMNKFLARIGLLGYVTIYDTNLPSGTNGRSSIGYKGSDQCKLRLRNGIDGEDLKRTAVHELGHVLGLKHEHQRYDRDDYLDITQTGHNYEKIPKEISGFRWNFKVIRIFRCRIRIPYPVWWTKTNCNVEGTFDFKSVMLYGDLNVKPSALYLNDYKTTTERHSEISGSDVASIKRMYR